MESSQNVDIDARKQAFDDYVNQIIIVDLEIQKEAVRNLIQRFKDEHDSEVGHILIDNFPLELLGEMEFMGLMGTLMEGFQDIELYFFDVFNFICQDRNLISQSKIRPFIELFTQFIKHRDTKSGYDPETLLKSLIMCISHEQNKIILIHENAMFNFYYHFRLPMINLEPKFWILCQSLYDIKPSNIGFLSRLKLTDSLSQIMTRLSISKGENGAMVLFNVLRMIHRNRLLEDIKFDIDQLFDITKAIFYRHSTKLYHPPYMKYVSKIWTNLFNIYNNSFEINSFEQLIVFAGIFSIDLSSKLREVAKGSDCFELNKNKRTRLYIIHLALVVYRMIRYLPERGLHGLLIRLHWSFKKYFKNVSIDNFPIETQFLILQYYIKSLITLNLKIVKPDIRLITNIFQRLQTYPQFKLHSIFIYSHLLFRISDHSKFIKSYFPSGLEKPKKVLTDLITALTDETYIDKLKKEQSLLLYEDVKTNHLSMICEGFLGDLFVACETDMFYGCNNHTPIVIDYEEYKMFKQVLILIIRAFNESNHLVKTMTDYYMTVFDAYSKYFSPTSSDRDKTRSVSLLTLLSTGSAHTHSWYDLPIHVLLSWFRLIYELKFIFGDINNKLLNFPFH
ncbi:hypothetical protein RF11_09573 [Thelohanellus kitauei]|uniref:Uncharacterized protein n=1 Tax=Thelohanellus kitauei TaxID=669202 RepID=A0A0C2IIN2_THEKT|nr:hypothetical protein RF11_09573 [Thelohanellus kitauei]